AKLRREIEDDRQVGARHTDNGCVEDADDRHWQAARSPLVSARRIAEAVADHALAPLERRPYCELKVRLPRRVKKHDPAERAKSLGLCGKQDFTDLFSARRPARLAGLQDSET